MNRRLGLSTLFTAILDGKAEVVRLELQQNPDLLNASYVDGNSPLILAIECDWPEVVDVLLEYGADPNSAFWPALLMHSERILRSLFESGADPNYRMPDGKTVAHLAAEYDDNNMLRVFLDHGVDPDLRQDDGATLLHYANRGLKGVSTAELIEYGVDPLAHDNGGDTPLHVAAGEFDSEMAASLLAAGADPLALNNDGHSPLYYALMPLEAGGVGICDDEHNVLFWTDGEAERNRIVEMFVEKVDPELLPLREAAALGYVDRVDTLFEADPTLLDAHDIQNYRLLHHAVFWNQSEVVRYLLNKGSSAGLLEGDDDSPLSVAAERGHLEIAEMLIESGADVNEWNEFAYTPLHSAADSDRSDMLRLLLEHGADPNLRTEEEQETPLSNASWKSPGCTALLIQAGADVNVQDWHDDTPLHNVDDEHCEIACMLIRAGADISIRNNSGRTPLMEAIFQSKCGLVKAILECAGYDKVTVYELAALDDLDRLLERLDIQSELLSMPDAEYMNRTLLHYAAEADAAQVTGYLLASGADPNKQDSDGNTPLHLAAGSKGSDAARLLLANGANPNQADYKWNRTPLFDAAYHQNTEVARLLLDYGADVNAQMSDGCTPLDDSEGRAIPILLRRYGGVSGRRRCDNIT